MNEDLRIADVQVRRATPVSEEAAARHVQERHTVAAQVENASATPLYVRTGTRAYDYDAATHTLTIYAAEPERAVPPGIDIISDHPRVPPQVAVGPGARATVEFSVPTTIRRRVPGEGLGMSFVEEPIGDIEQVDLHLQYADVPFQQVIGESPDELRQRLRAHGRVARATLRTSGSMEE